MTNAELIAEARELVYVREPYGGFGIQDLDKLWSLVPRLIDALEAAVPVAYVPQGGMVTTILVDDPTVVYGTAGSPVPDGYRIAYCSGMSIGTDGVVREFGPDGKEIEK